nr:hypothetical protein [Tanacetum cinerariifolium]
MCLFLSELVQVVVLGVHTPGSDEERFEQHELTGNVQQQSNDPPLSRGEAHSQEDQPEDQLRVLSVAKVLADAARKMFKLILKEERRLVLAMVEFVLLVGKDKGKGKMEESKDEQTKRTKLQQEQDRLGHEAAVRLQEELDEEERHRMARVHKETQSFTEKEWENIRARVKADEELAQRLQEKERNKYSEVDQAKMLVDLIS